MERLQRCVLEFQRKYGHPYNVQPTLNVSMEQRELRQRLIEEEFDELCTAMHEEDLVEIADALGDLLYVVLGCALAYGIDLEPVFMEIHRSNMTKSQGKEASGKTMKGPEYQAPRIQEILDVLAQRKIG